MRKTAQLLTLILATAAASTTTVAQKVAAPPAQPVHLERLSPLTTPVALAEPLTTTPRVEIVFVLDTTGSMGGLIQGAKDTIWSIVNQVSTARPEPEIRLGLVGFRDRGDSYVTTITALTDDLDAVYKALTAFEAGGGGDTPESVNLALFEAVTKMEWSNDPKTYRTIFLVGDAPPKSYPDEKQHPEICKMAIEKDVVINTVQCGDMTETRPPWQTIARAAEGRYFHVPQSGGVAVLETPFDADLARLGLELDGTTVYFGEVKMQEEMRLRKSDAAAVSRVASASASAERSVFQTSASGMSNFLGQNELVAAVEGGQVELGALPAEQLPPEMQALDEAGRRAYVEEKSAARKKAKDEITKLSEQRQKFIAEERARQAGTDTASSFDRAVGDALREQGAKKGLMFETIIGNGSPAPSTTKN